MITFILSKNKQKKRRYILFLFIFEILFFFQIFVGCQDEKDENDTTIIDDGGGVLKAECKENTLKFYYVANFSDYLEILYENYIDVESRPIYKSIDDIKALGVIDGTVYKNISQNLNIPQLRFYNTYDEMISDLRRHIIDGFFTCKEFANYIKMNNDDLTYFQYNTTEDIIHYNFLIQNLDDNVVNNLDDFISNNIEELKTIWFGCDNSTKKVNKILTGDKLKIIAALNFNEPPFAYIDSNGNKAGLIFDLLYRFANYSQYSLNILEINQCFTLEDLMENITSDIFSFMSFEEIDGDIIISEKIFDNDIQSVIVIRTENSEFESPWDIFIEIDDDFTGEKIGALNYTYDLTQRIFSQSEIVIKETVLELFNSLLLNDITAFFIDELTAKYYKKMASNMIGYYPNVVDRHNLTFFFTKEEVRDQFNEALLYLNEEEVIHLQNQTLEEIMGEIDVMEELINELDGPNKLNVVLTNKNIRPYSYIENGKYKGFEINIVYYFSLLYNYTITFDSEYETDNNVYIGYFNISDYEDFDFAYPSDAVYLSNIVLATRSDKIKDDIPITILDSKYREKISNDILIPLTYSGISKKAFCLFPTRYRDYVILNCSIFGLFTENKFEGEYELGNTTNKIRIKNLVIEAQNLLNANNVFPGYNLIEQTDMSGIICPDVADVIDLKKNKTSGFKITTASIIGIIVVGILFAAAILIIIIMYTTEIRNPKTDKKNFKMSNSELKLN